MEDNEADRRAGFVDSLLNVDTTESVPSVDVMNSRLQQMSQEPHYQENKISPVAVSDVKDKSIFHELTIYSCLFK